MDYDDNEFQGQNLQLGGEGCSKVSPVLHSYALPKFDFDDSFQGHLRFDSLVENEVFLGITSQEDNQWIEEYSRGSSGIEFSSSAVESRRNNVWSEATSSESVEMLLKSVGHEDKVTGEPKIQQLDISNEPDTVSKIMDPISSQDDGKDHVHPQNMSLPDEFSEDFQKLPDARFSSQTQDAQLSGGELDSVFIIEKTNSSLSEEKVDTPFDDSIQKEAKNENESKMPEDDKNECDIGKDAHQITSNSSVVSTDKLPDTGVGGSVELVGTELTEPCLADGVLSKEVLDNDVVAGKNTLEVHKGDSNDEDRCLPAKSCDSVQVNCESRPSELSAICVDQDIQALDYKKKAGPSLSVEGSNKKTLVDPNSETDTSVQVEQVAAIESDKSSLPDTSDGSPLLSGSVATADGDDQPKSPIFGVSLVHQDQMEKVEARLPPDNTCQNEIPLVESLVVSASKNPSSVVEKEASPGLGEKVVHELEVYSLSEKGGNNSELGAQLDPKESRMEVNESNEHQNLSDIDRPSEFDPNHIQQDGGSFSGLEKSQIVSPAHVSSRTTDDVDGNIQSVSSSKAAQEEKNFTFEVKKSDGVVQTGKGIQSYPTFQVSMLPKITEGPLPDSSSSQADAKKASVSPQNPSGTSKIEVKGKSERKPRRKSVGKESARKGNNVKEATPSRASIRVEKSSVPLTTPVIGQIILHEEVKSKENAERGGAKSTGVFPLPKLPDLNNSTSIFRQPFTDSQQVQLRAQILVYGSLISGSPPEEPHMVAAFGQYDGGRNWEVVWRACLERLHVQKAQINSTTPMQPRLDLRDAGSRADQGIKHTSIQNKTTSSQIGGATNKTTPSIVSPMIPPSSPFWNIPTPSDTLQSSGMPRPARLDYHQTPSSLQTYQTSAVQNFSLNNPSWLSQGPFAGQWVAAFNAGPHFPALPITEAVKLTPVKESAGPSITHTSSPMVTASSDHPSSDSKSRKRRKGTASATAKQISDRNPAQMASVSVPTVFHLPKTDSLTAPIVGSPFSTSVSVSIPAFITSKSSHHHSRSGDQNMGKLVISEETLSKVEESKLQAQDAAACAAAAISHCHGVWSQLERQTNLNSDDEAKLVSSAVSIAAAASVAKVAAAAAKIASNIAEQARSMVNLFPNSVIHDAREAAQQRDQAASASSKHAENLDAIVKAAELAAEAVSQAGKIVAMSEPLPLRQLIEAGPEGYWKTPASIVKNLNSADKNIVAVSEVSDKGLPAMKSVLSRKEKSTGLGDIQTMEVDDILVPSTSREKDKRKPRVRKGLDQSKTIEFAHKSDHGSIDTSLVGQIEPKVMSSTLKDNDIKEGCLVEVYKNDDNYDGAWFGANVLSLNDGKALVCYTEIQSDEGPLKEWVPLEVEGVDVPKIRVAHPVTTMRFEGTRKRRRTASTDFVWSSGDRVDVWIQDRWREGVVKETNKLDLTSLTIEFPAQGETSVVRSWFVRPTLIWKDGKWVDSHASDKRLSSQDDAPQEKRLKLGSPVVESGRNDGSSENVDLVDSKKQEDSITLPLSAHERLFSVGSTGDDKKLGTHNTVRGRLQKDGPGVIIGVPKPGKKQKFMDVSKHYVGDESNKNNPTHDSVKFTRYLIPQAPGSRGWRNNLRSDAKEKQAAESKPRTHKPRKPPIPSFRTMNKTASDSIPDDENQSGHQNSTDIGMSSNIEDAPKHTDVASSEVPTEPSKGVSTSTAKSERLNKRKFTPISGKPATVEKSLAEPVEQTRRSNRKIQPTSRLLEGLQSSMSISKIPSASHTAPRSHGKVTPKGNSNNEWK